MQIVHMHDLHPRCSRIRSRRRDLLAHMSFSYEGETPAQKQCAVCQRPVERADTGADVRLYLGPGDKLGELWLSPLCSYHVERFGAAHDQEFIECRVARIDRGTPAREAER